ncbi:MULTISPECIES: glycosyltransferase family 4 protein [unclassified Streptomyces]|uniref:glycosyltransferase family 4 protein n=2 Tax=Streptomyces TaxID=1883 RepID=UPI0001C189DB|nr:MULTISPECIES: glycosyltransferase family 4 protein [unclassified Streptomyces]AEN12666.1 glycosyl transferase group 1 [Streptomyces sp. SirexAA-E]MYR64672.1 glycosyltransferase [Streptomyces sp. SID4939]MYR99813.1 glycosyltransferase [Streptomyces sp. SID4940]MYT62799.1 glycosyltransferase [Streptomyces sp. SID8357]MYT89159.1 glycosyltransferase [Streptomyces sp. SID8360]
MPRTLVVTNDFPPRQGGIETFVHAMTSRFPADRVVVYTSSEPGAAAHDAALGYPVVRDRARTLLPTARVADRAAALARRYGCDSVWFGAAAPLALMAGRLRREAGIRRIVATTHGHEVWWARTPGTRALLRRIGERTDTVTYLGAATRAPVAAALGPDAARRMARLVPGVDSEVFRTPAPGGREAPGSVRATHGLRGRPVILCAARLVPRKGQDTLIRALPLVRDAVPDAVLLLAGDGPYGRSLRRLARSTGCEDAVVLAGGRPHTAMPAYFAAADVFAMPCRTRRRGLEVEGLGIVFLEAAAAGLPVVAGDSGGAPDAVRDGESGHVVDGRDVGAVAARLVELLGDPACAAAMGEKGRAWVQEEWTWETTYGRLAALLDAGRGRPDREGSRRRG